MPPVGFESTILERERPQTDALDRAATGICQWLLYPRKIKRMLKNTKQSKREKTGKERKQ
jgi:hypothetical protein